MIEQLLPAVAVAVEVHEDSGDTVLLPGEEDVVGRAVEKRRREFATGRACARAALAELGIDAAAILSGPRGEPLWPQGVRGSITHCEGYRGAAVARTEDVLTIGIDAEPHAPLPEGLIGDIARAEERPRLAELARSEPDVHWDRLLFSAKESVYKAWFPLAEAWLGFEDATLELEPARHSFSARLLVEGPIVEGQRLSSFSGRWLIHDGLVLTAVSMEPGAAAQPG